MKADRLTDWDLRWSSWIKHIQVAQHWHPNSNHNPPVRLHSDRAVPPPGRQLLVDSHVSSYSLLSQHQLMQQLTTATKSIVNITSRTANDSSVACGDTLVAGRHRFPPFCWATLFVTWSLCSLLAWLVPAPAKLPDPRHGTCWNQDAWLPDPMLTPTVWFMMVKIDHRKKDIFVDR